VGVIKMTYKIDYFF